jgi:hypothetical protein
MFHFQSNKTDNLQSTVLLAMNTLKQSLAGLHVGLEPRVHQPCQKHLAGQPVLHEVGLEPLLLAMKGRTEGYQTRPMKGTAVGAIRIAPARVYIIIQQKY